MEESTTIINTSDNGDRVMKFIISNHQYIAFTVFHCNIIVVEKTNEGPMLLLNRSCFSRNDLIKEFDKIILIATKVKDVDEFISKMDTYINLYDSSIHNETTEEIIGTYNIILESFNN